MKCERCEGLMLEDSLLDMEESFEGMWLRAWRCLNCGHALDSVIAANRHHAHQQSPHLEQKEIVLETLSHAGTPLAA